MVAIAMKVHDPLVLPSSCVTCPVRRFTAYSGIPAASIPYLESVRIGSRTLPARSSICYEAAASAELYTLYDGWAFTYKLLPDGRRQILEFLLPGDPIGLQALWLDVMPHSAQALTEVTLCVFDLEQFSGLTIGRPEQEWSILRYLAARQAQTEERLVDLGRRTAAERIARLILDICDHLGARGLGVRLLHDDSFPFNLRQEHIADALGLTKAHVSRTLLALRREGLVVDTKRRRVTLLDTACLRQRLA